MTNLIFAYLKIYRFNTRSINTAFVNEDYKLLSIGLSKYKVHIRKQILDALIQKKIDHPTLHKALIKILRDDFISVSTVANDILQRANILNPKFKKRYLIAREHFQERLMKNKNKISFYQSHPPRNRRRTADKSKRKQLERVREDLKKPLKIHSH